MRWPGGQEGESMPQLRVESSDAGALGKQRIQDHDERRLRGSAG